MDDRHKQQLYGFTDILFEQQDMVEVRFLPPIPNRKNQWFFNSPDEMVYEFDQILERNKRQDCYFGVNPRSERSGKAESIIECRALFADFDHTTVDAAIKTIDGAELPEPSVLVSSGHGVHAYWRLLDPIDPMQWSACQRGLIKLLNCDDKVKDPPRIMRLPFTKHVAKKQPGVDAPKCEIIFNRATRHDIEDIVRCLPPVDLDEDTRPEPFDEGACADLPAWANRFLVSGAQDGRRNGTAFDVACALKGAGWPREEAEKMILAGAARSSPPMPEDEAMRCVDSAWSKERTPAQVGTETPVGSAWQINAETAPAALQTAGVTDAGKTTGDNEMAVGEPLTRRTAGRLGLLSNVIETTDKEGNTTTHPKAMSQVVADIRELTGNWPRRAGGRLFVPGDRAERGALPDQYATRTLEKTDELFAWLHTNSELYWADGKRCLDQVDGSSRTSLKRSELFEHVRETISPKYEATEILPHEPPAPRTWYAPCILKHAGRGILDEFVGKLNAETELDRQMMLAATLTAFWGGPCGQRPVMLVSSTHGAGSGKTTTAEMIGHIAGGSIVVNSDEKPDQLIKRLLSDGGLAKRVVVVDNVKSRMDVAGIEQLVTQGEISGHRMYHGHATRPNRLVWFVTANAPSMSHDLAERSCNIRIGTQRADATWRSETEDWIEAHRPELVAACLGVLKGPDVSTIQPHNFDRWARWQSAVLQKVERADEIAALCRERRDDIDTDKQEAGEIAYVVRALVRLMGHDPDAVQAFLTRKALADAVRKWQGDEDDMGHRRTVSYINNRIGSGAASAIKPVKYGGERGYSWIGGGCLDPGNYQARVMEMPSDFAPDDVTKEMRRGEDEE